MAVAPVDIVGAPLLARKRGYMSGCGNFEGEGYY